MEPPIEMWRRIKRLWRRGEQERALDEELRFHIEQETGKNLRRGMEAEEARRAAVVRFGGVERVKEAARDELRPVLFDDLMRDVRYGVRTLVRAPAFAVVSVLTLGVGIGAATAIFTVVDGVLLKPLPYPEPDRIVRLFQIGQTGNRFGVSEPNYEDWRAQSRSFAAMAEMQVRGQRSVSGGSEPARAVVSAVSREFFDVLGMRPVRGRSFAAEDQREGAGPVVLVSDAYWRRWLDAAPSLADRTLTFDGRAYTVIGVMPRGFDYPAQTEIWFPRELEPASESRTAHNFQVVARVAEGRTVEQAQSELSAISRGLKDRHGDDTWMYDAAVIPLQEQLTATARPALHVLLGAAGFLLLIACANVSNLLLARSATRRRELAVRLALGAGRWRVARQLLAESVVLCLAGGMLGVWIAFAGVKGLLAMNPVNLPRLDEVEMGWKVLLFSFGVSLGTALLLGLATTWRVGERELRGSLTDGQRTMAGGRSSQHVRHALVVVQVALTMVLLTGAGLLGRSFLRLLAIEPGYRLDAALLVDLRMPSVDDESVAARQRSFQHALMTRLRALPGVEEVGGISDSPLGGGFYANGTFLEMTRPDEIQSYEDVQKLGDVRARQGFAGFRVASQNYFRAMGIPLLRGRAFEEGDAADAPHVALISASLAKARWPDQDPIGRFIQFGNMDGDLRGFRIVGVVGDVRESSPEALPGPLLYGEYRQRPRVASRFTIVIRGTDHASIATAAQRIVRELNPDLPIQISTAREAQATALAGRTFSLLLLGVFAMIALLLATLGIYGVISYLVTQRTREIGIRMALGASARHVLTQIVGQGALLALLGTALGVASALALTRLVENLLFEVSVHDPVAFAAVIGLLLAATAFASYVPARRASRVAPMITLRAE